MAEFSGLCSDGLGLKFQDYFRQFRTKFGFGFDPGTDVFGFCGVFWYLSNSMTNRKLTKKCPVLCGSKIWVILCVMVFMNNMQYVRIMLMHAY